MRVDQSNDNVNRIRKMSIRMRKMALDMALAAGNKGAHIGGGFSCMEIMAVMYGEILNIDVSKPGYPERDRLLISKNHCTLAHFPALVEKGFLAEEELVTYVENGSRLIGYPYDPSIGLEYSGGSLGMALSVGIGQAYSARLRRQAHRIYVLMGDGELNEGSVWEAFMAAAHYRLGNLVAIIDRNHLCYDGNTEDIMGIGDIEAKLQAFAWNVISCDGHDIADILHAFAMISEDMPNAIIAETIKGKGLSFAENRPEWHQRAITKEQYDMALIELTTERGC